MQFLGLVCALLVKNSSHPRCVVVALGSNLGSREDHLYYAVSRLRECLGDVRGSQFVETQPEGVPQQPLFLNAVAVGWSSQEPVELLESLQTIELERGRERPWVGAPRTLDMDLILVGSLIIMTNRISVPHPRFRARRFVLEPLVEVAPEVVDPVTNQTARELLDQMDMV